MRPRIAPAVVDALTRAVVAVVTVAGLAVAGLATAPSAAAQQLPPPTSGQTRIVGGSTAAPGQFPWMAALVRRGANRTSGFRCGGVVLSPSWVITAGHCVLDDEDLYPDAIYGPYVGPSYYDVVTGTANLPTGGQRLQVAAVYPHPTYAARTNDDDIALLRLARPTTAPALAVIGSSPDELALDDAGTLATVAGWGTLSFSSGTPEADLRYVEVPVQSDATCSSAYPPGFTDGSGFVLEYHADNMICAGPMAGGQDSCRGDSGGPLAVTAPDATWRLIGTVSFGYGCAEAGYPGVYQRLSASNSWIGRTRRFGPFNPDATAYVTQQFRDFVGRAPTGDELSLWRSYLSNAPAADIVRDLQAGASWDGNADMNVRLYRAAFLRDPDSGGLDYWVRQRWAGRGPVSIANHFTASPEFIRRYGSLSDDAFIARIYQNVFERDPDPQGRDYWNRKLAAGTGRGQVLYELSNSSEYRRDTADRVRVISTQFGLLRTVPAEATIAASEALSQRTLIDELRTSVRYAQRFDG